MSRKRSYGEYDYVFKLVLVGNCNVGKTALTRRFADKRFIEHYDSTIGIDYGSTIVNIPNSIPIKCQIWDTAGQETFAPLSTASFIVFHIGKSKVSCPPFPGVTPPTTFVP